MVLQGPANRIRQGRRGYDLVGTMAVGSNSLFALGMKWKKGMRVKMTRAFDNGPTTGTVIEWTPGTGGDAIRVKRDGIHKTDWWAVTWWEPLTTRPAEQREV